LLSLSAARRALKSLDIPERSDRDRVDVTLKIPDPLQALRVSPRSPLVDFCESVNHALEQRLAA